MRRIVINAFIIGFILLPFILWLIWIVKPSSKAKILLLDKTSITSYGLEHRTFDWVLTYQKYYKPNGQPYSPSRDYFGFFPLNNDSFLIKDLSKFSGKQIDSLSSYFDMTYYTDTYGVFYNEWYRKTNKSEPSEKVYGGLDENDVLFLAKMKEKKKLIMAEFNLFGSPANASKRTEVENILGLKWSGWAGRYFEQLDTLKNPELPKWVVRLYKEQHQNKWPFTKPGIVFIHMNETIAILEKETDLKQEVPIVKSFRYGIEKFNLPKAIRYPYWFDITLSTDTNNRVVSYYEISTNLRGDSILHRHNIPKIFPAAFENLQDSHFYYFCGDFTDSPVHKTFNQFTGIKYFKMLVLNEFDLNDRTPFFWRYYLPMTSKILEDNLRK